jgi:two-component system, OmpR family, response regulator
MKQTLLLVDDDPPILETFSRYLTKEGYSVHTADGGEKAIAVLRTLTPDAILLDIMMEPMDGWETLLAIRDNPKTQAVPVMMVTAKSPTWDEIQKYGGEMDDFVMKPRDLVNISVSVRQTIAANARMVATIETLRARGADPDKIHEYVLLLRKVRITQKLFGGFRPILDGDTNFLGQEESRLAQLEQELGNENSFAGSDLDPGGRRAV